MEIEIIEKKENPLLNRTEIRFKVKHQGEKTPERELVKNDLAEMLNIKKNLVIIDHIRASFGVAVSTGYAKIYKSAEDAKRVEPEYILKRNKFEGEKEGQPEEKTGEKVEKKEEKIESGEEEKTKEEVAESKESETGKEVGMKETENKETADKVEKEEEDKDGSQ